MIIVASMSFDETERAGTGPALPCRERKQNCDHCAVAVFFVFFSPQVKSIYLIVYSYTSYIHKYIRKPLHLLLMA